MTFTNFSGHANHDHNVSEVGVWYCENCRSFHIKAGEVLLTFTRAEFGSFSSAVFDCYSSAVTLEDVRGNANPGNELYNFEVSPLTH
jgi:hypothetical protein